mmetsp:Transcript_12177/g.16905  ORF Transcript_12177/g.16905 Transcript_12177/m.16905 type:complete len:97 (+) Transcript_12177:129-419(+)
MMLNNLAELMEENEKKSLSASEIKRKLKLLDTNNDGKVDLSEFLANANTHLLGCNVDAEDGEKLAGAMLGGLMGGMLAELGRGNSGGGEAPPCKMQ